MKLEIKEYIMIQFGFYGICLIVLGCFVGMIPTHGTNVFGSILVIMGVGQFFLIDMIKLPEERK